MLKLTPNNIINFKSWLYNALCVYTSIYSHWARCITHKHTYKNPAYGIHLFSWRVRIVAPIQYFQFVVVVKKKMGNKSFWPICFMANLSLSYNCLPNILFGKFFWLKKMIVFIFFLANKTFWPTPFLGQHFFYISFFWPKKIWTTIIFAHLFLPNPFFGIFVF